MTRVSQTKVEFIKKDIETLYNNLHFRSLKPEKQRIALMGQLMKSLDFHVGDGKDSLDYLDRLMEELNIKPSPKLS